VPRSGETERADNNGSNERASKDPVSRDFEFRGGTHMRWLLIGSRYVRACRVSREERGTVRISI